MNLVDNIKTQNYVEKFLLSAKQMGLTNKKEWLEKLLDSDRFFYRKELEGNPHSIRSISKKLIIKNQIFELIDLFNRKYEKQWDIQLNSERVAGKIKFEIIFFIKYDSLNISNSKNLNRNIKDLIVALPISYNSEQNCIYFLSIMGTRFSFSHDEWYSGYVHSHLYPIPKEYRINRFDRVGKLNPFCLGSSELSELTMELSTTFDINQLELMLYTIDSYVIWESLEGVPYIKMKSITLQDPDLAFVPPSYETFSRLYRYFLDKLTIEEKMHLPLEFIYTEGRYKIKNFTKLNDFIKNKFINTNLSEYNYLILCKKGTDNIYYSFPRNSQSLENPKEALNNTRLNNELPFLYIQGKKIEFSIINIEEQSLIDINNYNIHPKFLKYVNEQFECQIYKSCIRGSAINYVHNSSNYVRSNSE